MMMKQHNKYLLLLFTLSLTLTSYAQLPTSQWQTHMSYVEGQRLAMSNTKVYCVASGSLFSYGLNDNAIETYSKVNGLSDVYISDIAYCDEEETLVICYANGNIDLMSKDGIVNVPDLYLKAIYGDKTINKIDIIGEVAYISTAFGILKLNIEKAEIAETYKLTYNDANGVNGIAISNNQIYAATDNGLYKANLNTTNLQNFTAWSLEETIGDYSLPVVGIINFSDHIITAQKHSGGYYIKAFSDSWRTINSVGAFQSFGANDDFLMIANTTNIRVHNKALEAITVIDNYNFTEPTFTNQNSINIHDVIPINENSFWAADNYSALVIQSENSLSKNIQPKGPATNTIWNMDMTQNVLRTVHGATTIDYNNTWTPGAISSYIGNTWTHMAKYNGGKSFYDFVGIITDPLDLEHFYVSTFGYGLLEYQNDEFVKQYNENNSTLENAIPGSNNFTRTIGMAFDNNNNLWVNNSSAYKQLHVKTTDDQWYAFESKLPKEQIRYGEILITEDNVKWMVTPYFGDGILVYDDKGTFDDASDDEDRYFDIHAADNNGNLELVSDKVYDITMANDGVIWVGNDNGVALYYNPSDIFQSKGDPVASRINIARNDGTGYGDYLLNETTVQSIAVDGGNRKWLATASTGVMLVSPDGQKVLHHFTKENSPLLSNNVRQVEVNQETGEVFFATDAGLISFQADATNGNDDFSNIKVYPNPVREDFSGDITITGLVEETTVKITDVSGNLVNETQSNGGTAIWDGKNFYGERVGTGVYLIFCSDKTGDRSGMTKVLVVN